MPTATLTRARAIAFRLAPEEQFALVSDIVDRVSGGSVGRLKKKTKSSVGKTIGQLSKAIGAPLAGKDLDDRLRKAISGKEKGVPASLAIKRARKRLGL